MEALGYVGFGLSPNGGMTGSDVVIGWVLDDGTAVFHVRIFISWVFFCMHKKEVVFSTTTNLI